MSITASNIKLLASERMTDTSDGGGRRTSNVIPDGVPGNIFAKVSRLDSVYGRVNLIKVFSFVDTVNRDTYAGAHAVIMDAPDNDKIHVTAFSTGSDFDYRTAARDRIESYVIAGPESRMTLYGRQLVGQGAISAYQQPLEPLPEVGEVYCLSAETGGVVSYQQFVRITDVTHDVRTLEDEKGAFERRVVTMKISTPLRYEFAGPDAPSRYTSTARPALIRRTSVADAARYFGIQPLAEAATAGALEVKVASVYAPIVPTTQRETPLSNGEIAGVASLVAAGPQVPAYAMPHFNWPSSTVQTRQIYLPGPIVPGSLVFSARLTLAGGIPVNVLYSYADDGNGGLSKTSSQGLPGSIDYAAGVITFTRTSSDDTGWDFTVGYQRAVEVSQVTHMRETAITLATRGTVFVQTLNPLPMPGSLVVDFRALGKWYRLRDDGAGALSGDDAAYGTGTVDYTTGAVVATIGALPDVGSSVLMAWASPVHYVVKAGATSDAGATVKQHIQLDQLPVKPGSVVITYTAGVTVYTATEVAGVISGGGVTGTVNHTTGAVDLEYSTHVPNVGTAVHVAYKQETPSGATPTSVSGTLAVPDRTNIALGQAVTPGGLSLTVPLMGPTGSGVLYNTFIDDLAGNVVTFDRFASIGDTHFKITGGQIVGTVNYATGVVSLNATVGMQESRYSYVLRTWSLVPVNLAVMTGDSYTYTIKTGAASTDADKTLDAYTADFPLLVDLTRTSGYPVMPGSAQFSFTGKPYFERNGTLYTDLLADGSATAAGTIDYATGAASLSYWVDNVALALAVHSCLVRYGTWVAVEAMFRTAGSPLRPESGYVQVTAEDGTLITATSDADGYFVSAKARGKINNDMGVVSIQWGEMVLAAGNETEDWYDPANVVGPNVWKPKPVFPGTLRYNGVVLSNLPLNADILGLDPVRLPSDGRVPIFRPADVAVIHNTQALVLPNPPVAGATYNMGRTDLSELWLVDWAGARVAAAKYVADLAAGTVTMDAALDLTGAALPWTVKHRIEQMVLVSDVQINGQISLAGALARDFGLGSYLSSALLFGDMFARVTGVFDQVTWTNVWSDARIGANATGEYDTVNYPVEVVNDAAVTDRWRINFTTTTAFQVISENLGVIATGTTGADLQPLNSLTGKPYFTLRAAGWGAGWAAGNQLRFNTIGAAAPMWLARTVLPGATLSGDSLDLQLRGDVDV